MLVNITPLVRRSEAPPGFHMLSKPTGAACNLDCKYCFFLSKDMLYPKDPLRMSDEMLEAYIKQLLESHRTPITTVAWQGGEPTLMGVDFYRRSIDYVQKYRRPGQQVEYTFQTNGVLIDDYVEPDYKLGNIAETHMLDMVASPAQSQFGVDKQAKLTKQCLECDVRFLCNGGCPKDRFVNSVDGEPGHNYLCAGFKSFFDHVNPAMQTMAGLVSSNRAPAEIMQVYAAKDFKDGRNDPCHCGSGKKFKRCHGQVLVN